MKKTKIKIQKMDCPSEIKMIEGIVEKIDQDIKMEFDLVDRTVSFYHNNDASSILKGLDDISLSGTFISSEDILESELGKFP